jgi:O-antigen/teichoic acid export membrane protein
MSSLTNFAVSIYVARALGATQFGAFSLAYVTYSVILTGSRGLATDPLMVRFSGTDLPTWRRAVAGCTGTAAVLGLATGACVLAAAAVLHGTAGRAFLALGLTLPGLLLQDSWRYAFFARGHGHHAFINDTVWALVLLPALLLVRITGHMNVFWFVLAWGAAANVAAAIAPLQARVVPNLAGATKWLSRHRDLGPRYLLENTGGNLSVTLRTFSVASILTLAAVGYMQAANTLMGPFVIILAGVSLITLPEAAKLMRRSPRHLPIFCAASSAVLSLLAGVWGAVLLVGLPRGLGQLMLGQLWRPTYPLVLPATLAMMASCLTSGALLGLHALGAARLSLRYVLRSATLGVIFAIVGALIGGTLGAMQFIAIASLISTLMSWWQFRYAMRVSGKVPVPRWLWPGRPAHGDTASS